MHQTTQHKQPPIAVVGSINCDLTTYMAQFPAVNETVMASQSNLALGGKGLNQAIAAARIGNPVTMISCVGNDSFGDLALDYLKDNHIDNQYVRRSNHQKTGTAAIYVSAAAENMIAVSPGANAELSVAAVNEAKQSIINAHCLIAQLEVPLAAVRQALEIAKNAGTKTILNPAPANRACLPLLALADIVTPNETETELLTGIYPDDEQTALQAAHLLRKHGASTVIITLGEKGSFVLEGDRHALIRPPKVDAIDPTGAGDVFNGALTSHLANGHDIFSAVERANIAAAISVTRRGAENTAPYTSEIEMMKQKTSTSYDTHVAN